MVYYYGHREYGTSARAFPKQLLIGQIHRKAKTQEGKNRRVNIEGSTACSKIRKCRRPSYVARAYRPSGVANP